MALASADVSECLPSSSEHSLSHISASPIGASRPGKAWHLPTFCAGEVSSYAKSAARGPGLFGRRPPTVSGAPPVVSGLQGAANSSEAGCGRASLDDISNLLPEGTLSGVPIALPSSIFQRRGPSFQMHSLLATPARAPSVPALEHQPQRPAPASTARQASRPVPPEANIPAHLPDPSAIISVLPPMLPGQDRLIAGFTASHPQPSRGVPTTSSLSPTANPDTEPLSHSTAEGPVPVPMVARIRPSSLPYGHKSSPLIPTPPPVSALLTIAAPPIQSPPATAHQSPAKARTVPVVSRRPRAKAAVSVSAKAPAGKVPRRKRLRPIDLDSDGSEADSPDNDSDQVKGKPFRRQLRRRAAQPRPVGQATAEEVRCLDSPNKREAFSSAQSSSSSSDDGGHVAQSDCVSDEFSAEDSDAAEGEPAARQPRQSREGSTAKAGGAKGPTVADLRAELKAQGLPVSGTKAVLLARLSDPAVEGSASAATKSRVKASKKVASSVRSTGGSEGGGTAGRGRLAKPKGRDNFVRMNMKVSPVEVEAVFDAELWMAGGGRFKFKSKSGTNGQTKRFSRFPKRQDAGFLKQAGEGADYMEGYERQKQSRCFKCGGNGHWAADCPGPVEDTAPVESGESDAEPKPAYVPRPSNIHSVVRAPPYGAPAAAAGGTVVAEPMWEPEGGFEAVAADPSEEALTEVAQKVFGFEGFRGLQLPIIQRIMAGKSTLAIMPTGAGKSLCYQLPALVGGGTVLVVSPLLALMRDQLAHLPAGMPAAMLWGGQPRAAAMAVLDDLRAGKLRVLFVAPERLHSTVLNNALAPLLPLPLVCVDEAHCVSEWGHNFRSAYFRLGHMLRTQVRCKAVLALTATATSSTAAAVARVLDIAPEGVIRDDSVRSNLRLSVHHSNGGTESGATKRSLLHLLRGGRLNDAKSVIVYCTYQNQCSSVAAFLDANSVPAAAYHAGKPWQEREAIQSAFCSGSMRVVVATVAFGMGLDAAGVRGVVHMSLPRSLEEYVQQVGRAGRDGSEAQCALFLDDLDYRRLRSLAHSDGVGAPAVKRFLTAAFADPPQLPVAKVKGKSKVAEAAQKAAVAAAAEAAAMAAIEGPQYRVLEAKRLTAELDMKEEVMETLCSHLEADEDPYLRVLPPTGAGIQVAFYNRPAAQLAAEHPIVAALLASCPNGRNGCHTVSMATFVAAARLPPHQILQQLQAIAAQQELRFEVNRNAALVIQIQRQPEDMSALASRLAAHMAAAEQTQVGRLDTCYRSLATAATEYDTPAEQEAYLRTAIAAYFEERTMGEEPRSDAAQEGVGVNACSGGLQLRGLPLKAGNPSLAMDVRELMAFAKRQGTGKGAAEGGPLTGRAIARILHGVSSPAFPTKQWSKCGFWARYVDVDYCAVQMAAEKVLSTIAEN